VDISKSFIANNEKVEPFRKFLATSIGPIYFGYYKKLIANLEEEFLLNNHRKSSYIGIQISHG